MQSSKDLKSRIENLENRNKRVETDKAWEISYLRKFLLAAFTYLAIGFYLMAIGIYRPWLNAIVPSIGFMLSTLTLPIFKKLWIKYRQLR